MFHRNLIWLGAIWLCAAAVPALRAQESPPGLERALIRQAPEVLQALRDKGCQNVGVLKFLVISDGNKLSDNVGTLNRQLARQLETALILKNSPKNPVGIVEDANVVAAKTPGANHLSKEGRLKLFAARYPLAWGNQEVPVDAFVTGIAEIGADLRTITVSLLAFDRTENKITPVGKDFRAMLRPSQLVEFNESFLVRGLFDGGKVTSGKAPAKEHAATEAIYQATKVHAGAATHPLKDAAAPISLQVYYDGKVVPLEFRQGKAFIASPKQGQKVTLGLKSVAVKGRFGVVLKVNGENTIGRQKLPDAHCRMWILDAGEGPYTLKGFQLNNKDALAFRVASVRESQQREISYGADVGTITMTVFAEQTGKAGNPSVDPEDAYTEVVEKTYRPNQTASSYDALKQQMIAEANSRGLIVEGDRFGSSTQSVSFVRNPTPVMCVTIVYYNRTK